MYVKFYLTFAQKFLISEKSEKNNIFDNSLKKFFSCLKKKGFTKFQTTAK